MTNLDFNKKVRVKSMTILDLGMDSETLSQWCIPQASRSEYSVKSRCQEIFLLTANHA